MSILHGCFVLTFYFSFLTSYFASYAEIVL